MDVYPKRDRDCSSAIVVIMKTDPALLRGVPRFFRFPDEVFIPLAQCGIEEHHHPEPQHQTERRRCFMAVTMRLRNDLV